MASKLGRKKAKQIQKKVDKLYDRLQKLEIQPCKGDDELKQREKDIDVLKTNIFLLEKERDQYLYTWWEKASATNSE